MYINHVKAIKSTQVHAPGCEKVIKQNLIGPENGWEGWVMRLFTFEPGGHTPKHTHPWPHINYIVNGTGVLLLNGQEHDIQSGSVAYVPEGAEHQFQNRGEEEFSFICIVPEKGDA